MRAYNFLRSISIKLNPITLNPEGFKHILKILDMIYFKFMDPSIPECKFVTLCFNEDWEKAKLFADDMNKQALQYNIIQDFVKHIKQCPEYIQKNREDKINNIIKN
jgi:hypothetical protein